MAPIRNLLVRASSTLLVALAAGLPIEPCLAQLKVGVTLSTTGGAASLGSIERNVANLWPKTLGGMSVEYIVLDDASEPSNAVKNARRLVSEDRVDVIFGSSTSPNSIAMVPVAEETGTPLISLASAMAIVAPMDKARRWVFKTVHNDSSMIEAVLDDMQRRQVKRLGYIGLADATGEGYLAALQTMAASRGIELVRIEKYNRADTSVTAQVLRQTDAKTGKPLVDVIVDEAEQKGTGRWTVKSALDLGVPVTGIAEAVFARALSGSVPQRRVTVGMASGGLGERPTDATQFIEDVRQALYASKIIAYAQGFNQIQVGSDEYHWGVTPGDLATIWRGGCIIRAKFLNRIKEAFDAEPDLPTLIAAPYFRSAISSAIDGWRRVVVTATELGIPIPGFASALSYYDALRTERLPAALIQGQRDFFGAHTYGRTDADPAARFHTQWSGDRTEVQA